MALHFLYGASPDPPVSPAAPLAFAAASTNDDGVDRISLLPDQILKNVVARLPAKDDVRTSALASRWRGLWRSVPLVLVDAHILPDFWSPSAWRPAATTLFFRWRARLPRLQVAFTRMRDELVARWQGLQLGASRRGFEPPRRRGIPRPGRAPGPLPLRAPHLEQHGRAPGRDRALAEAPRRQGRPRTRLYQPPVAAGPPSPRHALQLHLPHQPARRRLEVPGHRHAAARRPLPPPPGARPQLGLHAGPRPCLPAREKPHPGGPHHHRKPERGAPPPGEPHPAVAMCGLADVTVVDAPRLERLFLWMIVSRDKCSRIKIGHAPNLRMLGHWQPGDHELEIGNTVIEARTMVSPSTIVPSVKVLALEVQFEVRDEVRMVPCFLKCFPNVETLHVYSHNADNPTGKVNLKFWQEAGYIECVQRHLKKFVFQEFWGKRSELR